MGLYLGDTKIALLLPNRRPWWGVAQNPELLYESNFQCALDPGTNYSSKTPSSSQQSVNFLNPPYGSATTTATIDRWGIGYHDGTALDFKLYEYYVLADYLIDVAYISSINEATWGKTHTVKYVQTSIMPIYRNYTVSGQNVLYGNLNNNTLTVGYYGTSRLWYRTAANALSSASTTYGFYLTPAAISLSGTNINNPVEYVNFRTPTLYFRSSSTYHNLTAFIEEGVPQVDAENTIFKMRQRLYRAEKTENYYETLVNRQAYIFNNSAFPIEAI